MERSTISLPSTPASISEPTVDSTMRELGSDMNTTSAPSAASTAVAHGSATPLKTSMASFERSNTRTSLPASMTLWQMPLPMAPRPMKPTLYMRSCLPPRYSARIPRKLSLSLG